MTAKSSLSLFAAAAMLLGLAACSKTQSKLTVLVG